MSPPRYRRCRLYRRCHRLGACCRWPSSIVAASALCNNTCVRHSIYRSRVCKHGKLQALRTPSASSIGCAALRIAPHPQTLLHCTAHSSYQAAGRLAGSVCLWLALRQQHPRAAPVHSRSCAPQLPLFAETLRVTRWLQVQQVAGPAGCMSSSEADEHFAVQPTAACTTLPCIRCMHGAQAHASRRACCLLHAHCY